MLELKKQIAPARERLLQLFDTTQVSSRWLGTITETEALEIISFINGIRGANVQVDRLENCYGRKTNVCKDNSIIR